MMHVILISLSLLTFKRSGHTDLGRASREKVLRRASKATCNTPHLASQPACGTRVKSTLHQMYVGIIVSSPLKQLGRYQLAILK
jgi:hypothetical protein